MKTPNRRDRSARAATGHGHLASGREHCERGAWADAYSELSLADQEVPLGAEDLELLATAAYLVGRDDEYIRTLERAHNAHVNAGQCARAARSAFWLGFRLLMRGETGHATGWLSRAQRLVERDGRECAEQGYLMLTVVEQRMESCAYEDAYATAADAAAIGERCGDLDLVACARHQQGRIRLQQAQVEAGLALLDETMVMVLSGELSLIVTGLMYCSVIAACQEVYALDRAREWIAALSRWCDSQRDMVAFAGTCQVHRAEIMQLQGTWPEAMDEARRAFAQSHGLNRRAAAAALYQQAEVCRLKGEFAAAEETYRRVSELGQEPQPGFALLRLAQGRSDAAATAMRRVASTRMNRLERLNFLPAFVEVMLAVGDIEEARNAAGELAELAHDLNTAVPRAIAAQARGAVDLAENKPQASLGSLRPAFDLWQAIPAPHAAARVRVLIGRACRALGDDDGAELEFDAARSTFEDLGAAPDLAGMDPRAPGRTHPLTRRETQVLRLVAAGKTNATVAAELCLSERTVERHLSNIFTKLGLSTRTAATAWAFRHGLT